VTFGSPLQAAVVQLQQVAAQVSVVVLLVHLLVSLLVADSDRLLEQARQGCLANHWHTCTDKVGHYLPPAARLSEEALSADAHFEKTSASSLLSCS
jgi:hypothetical protein